jgi:hypothetical protein
MSTKTTISEALGLSQVWADKNQQVVEKAWSKHDTVSDTIRDVLEQMRDAEFGETGEKPTTYEIKLMVAGMHIGAKKGEMAMKKVLFDKALEQMTADLMKKARGEESED